MCIVKNMFTDLMSVMDGLTETVAKTNIEDLQKDIASLNSCLVQSSMDTETANFNSERMFAETVKRHPHRETVRQKVANIPGSSKAAKPNLATSDITPPVILRDAPPLAQSQLRSGTTAPEAENNTSSAGHVGEGWKKVAYKRRRNTREVVGTGVETIGLKAARPTRITVRETSSDFFVGRCNPQMSVADLQDFVKKLGISTLDCKSLKTPVWYSSFCIKVEKKFRQTLLDPARWPIGVIVRPFYHRVTNQRTLETASRSRRLSV